MQLRAIYEETLARLDPRRKVVEALSAREPPEAVTVLSLGKSAVPMALGARDVLGDRIREECVVAPELPNGAPVGWMASTHPRLSEHSMVAGQKLLKAAARAQQLLVLISGGGSALACAAPDGLDWRDSAALINAVYAAGAKIAELNAIRKHLSVFKGGGLARAAAHVPALTLIMGDVVGDELSSIASGPTCSDASRFEDALAIARHYLGAEVSGPALDYLRAGVRGEHAETLKSVPKGHEIVLLAGVSSLAQTAACVAREGGEQTRLITPCFEDGVAEVAARVSSIAAPGLWVQSGEATIALPATPGRGGRALHLALTLAQSLHGRAAQALVAGSDGVDGNAPAAGAVVDGETWSRAKAAGLDPEAALQSFDSYPLLRALGATLEPGATGLNLADLVLLRIA